MFDGIFHHSKSFWNTIVLITFITQVLLYFFLQDYREKLSDLSMPEEFPHILSSSSNIGFSILHKTFTPLGL